jgi:hypothetical protein
MLLTIFSPFYEWICGSNGESPEYNDNGIYDSVGFITVAVTLLLTIVFYVLLGRWKPVFYTIRDWIITLFINAFIGFGLAFTSAKGELGSIDGYLIRFAIINAIFTIVLFFMLSIILKRASIFAKRTPF